MFRIKRILFPDNDNDDQNYHYTGAQSQHPYTSSKRTRTTTTTHNRTSIGEGDSLANLGLLFCNPPSNSTLTTTKDTSVTDLSHSRGKRRRSNSSSSIGGTIKEKIRCKPDTTTDNNHNSNHDFTISISTHPIKQQRRGKRERHDGKTIHSTTTNTTGDGENIINNNPKAVKSHRKSSRRVTLDSMDVLGNLNSLLPLKDVSNQKMERKKNNDNISNNDDDNKQRRRKQKKNACTMKKKKRVMKRKSSSSTSNINATKKDADDACAIACTMQGLKNNIIDHKQCNESKSKPQNEITPEPSNHDQVIISNSNRNSDDTHALHNDNDQEDTLDLIIWHGIQSTSRKKRKLLRHDDKRFVSKNDTNHKNNNNNDESENKNGRQDIMGISSSDENHCLVSSCTKLVSCCDSNEAMCSKDDEGQLKPLNHTAYVQQQKRIGIIIQYQNDNDKDDDIKKKVDSNERGNDDHTMTKDMKHAQLPTSINNHRESRNNDISYITTELIDKQTTSSVIEKKQENESETSILRVSDSDFHHSPTNCLILCSPNGSSLNDENNPKPNRSTPTVEIMGKQQNHSNNGKEDMIKDKNKADNVVDVMVKDNNKDDNMVNVSRISNRKAMNKKAPTTLRRSTRQRKKINYDSKKIYSDHVVCIGKGDEYVRVAANKLQEDEVGCSTSRHQYQDDGKNNRKQNGANGEKRCQQQDNAKNSLNDSKSKGDGTKSNTGAVILRRSNRQRRQVDRLVDSCCDKVCTPKEKETSLVSNKVFSKVSKSVSKPNGGDSDDRKNAHGSTRKSSVKRRDEVQKMEVPESNLRRSKRSRKSVERLTPPFNSVEKSSSKPSKRQRISSVCKKTTIKGCKNKLLLHVNKNHVAKSQVRKVSVIASNQKAKKVGIKLDDSSGKVKTDEVPVSNEWDDESIKLLLDAHKQVDPKSFSFWHQVAARVPSMTAEQCRNKFFAFVKTPKLQRKKKGEKETIKNADIVDDSDDIFNSTPIRDAATLIGSTIDEESSAKDKISNRLSSSIMSSIYSYYHNTDKGEWQASPLHFRPQTKGYIKKVSAGLNGNKFGNRRRKVEKKKGNKKPLCIAATIDAGDVHMDGVIAMDGTVIIDTLDEDDIENSYLPDDDSSFH